jgi:hypothetical protein
MHIINVDNILRRWQYESIRIFYVDILFADDEAVTGSRNKII